MGVRAIVVSEKIQHNMRVYFRARRPNGFWIQRCCWKQTHHFTPYPAPLSSAMVSPPTKMLLSFHTGDYRVEAAVTLSMKDLFNENIQFEHFLFGKNVNFSDLKGKGVENNLEIWNYSSPVHPLLSPLSFFLHPVWLSAMCFSLSVPLPRTLNTLGRHIFSCSETTQNKT